MQWPGGGKAREYRRKCWTNYDWGEIRELGETSQDGLGEGLRALSKQVEVLSPGRCGRWMSWERVGGSPDNQVEFMLPGGMLTVVLCTPLPPQMGRRPARCYRYCKNKPYPKVRSLAQLFSSRRMRH